MSGIELHRALAPLRLQAVERLVDLMGQVRIGELTTPEVIAIVSAFESAHVRISAGTARVVRLRRRDSEVRP